MILQDPQTSLNPVFSVGEQLREAIFRRTRGSKAEIMKEAVGALRRVEIAAPGPAHRSVSAPDERRHEAACCRRHIDQRPSGGAHCR